MTTFSLPPQAPVQPAVAALGLANSGGGQSDDQDGSASAAFLGALSDAAAQSQQGGGSGSANADGATAQAGAASDAGTFRGVSAIHALGSGALLAWRDQFGAASPTGAGVNSLAANASARANTGLASMISVATSSAVPGASALAAAKGALASPTIQPIAPAAATPAAGAASPAAILALSDQVVGPSASAKGQQTTSASATGKNADAEVDPTALTNIGWASLILGASGASGAAAPAAAAAASTPSAHTSPGAALPALPSDPSLVTTTLPGAVKAAATASPVDVKVVRNITYLGLDATTRGVENGQAPAGRSRPTAAAGATTAQAAPGAPSAVAAGGAQSQAAASGDLSQSNYSGAGRGDQAAGAAAAADSAADVSQAGTASVADASVAAMLGSVAAPVSLDQLGDLIASAAGDLNASPNAGAQVDAAASARTAPIKELDVQLNPATLGALSIEMRLSDGKLSVTIKADKADTMKLIESERDSISSKLTSLNFSVESLTVKASDAPSAAAPGTDASNSGMASNGGAQQGQPGQTGDGAQSGSSLRGGANQGQQPAPAGDAFAEPGGVDNLGDVYV